MASCQRRPGPAARDRRRVLPRSAAARPSAGRAPGSRSTTRRRRPAGRSRSRSPPMTGLSCSPTRRDAEDLRLERLPRPREQGVIGAAALGQRPSPRPAAPRAGASDRTVAAPSPPGRPTWIEKPSRRPARSACFPTSRCQRATSPRCVRPMLPVPSPPIGTPAHVAVVDHRLVDARVADVRARAAPIGRAPGDAGIPAGRGGPRGRSLLDAGDDDAAHERPLGEEEDDDRDGHRHERGGLDQRRLGRVQRVVLLDRRSTAAGAPACSAR